MTNHRTFLLGLTSGAAFGALTGLADCVRASLEGGNVLTVRHWLPVVAIYSGFWVVPGLLASLVARLLFRSVARRATVLIVALGSAVFAVGAYVNVVVLPSFTAPESLRFDAVLVVAAAVLLFLLTRARVPVLVPGARSFLVLLLLIFATCAGAGMLWVGRKHDRVDVDFAAADAPNVLVYLVDALRSDHLGTYGYSRDTSPNFDGFAKGAAVFTACRAASTWTKPSTASILTGLLPTAHGAVEHREILSGKAVTLAEVLLSAGYRTAAFSDNPFVSPEFGFEQGFEEFDYEAPSVFVNGSLLGKALWTLRLVSMGGEVMGESLVRTKGSPELCSKFLGWLDAVPADRPWFAYVHAMEPHLPYDPPVPHRGAFADPAYSGADHDRPPRYMGFLPFEPAPALPDAERRHLVDRYDEEIRTWDAAFGELLAELERRGLAGKTILVVLSDHGEEFYEHQGWTHGHSLYEELVRVPLAIRGPGIEPSRIDLPVRTADLAHTITELTGTRPRDPLPGRDLLAADRRAWPLVSEVRMGGAAAACIVHEGKKLVLARRGDEERRLAFDLATDPGEESSVTDPPWGDAHAKLLESFLRAAAANSLRGSERRIGPQEEETLRGLGYTR